MNRLQLIAVRKKWKLTQVELGLLIGERERRIQWWELGNIDVDEKTLIFYRVLSQSEVRNVLGFIIAACEREYLHKTDVKALRDLIRKFEVRMNPMTVAELELRILELNPRWTANDLGFGAERFEVSVNSPL